MQREQAGAIDVQGRLKTLTAREAQVFALVVTGMLNKQIAAELGIVEKTVKVHRARVMEKMRAGSLAELVRLGGPGRHHREALTVLRRPMRRRSTTKGGPACRRLSSSAMIPCPRPHG